MTRGECTCIYLSTRTSRRESNYLAMVRTKKTPRRMHAHFKPMLRHYWEKLGKTPEGVIEAAMCPRTCENVIQRALVDQEYCQLLQSTIEDEFVGSVNLGSHFAGYGGLLLKLVMVSTMSLVALLQFITGPNKTETFRLYRRSSPVQRSQTY